MKTSQQNRTPFVMQYVSFETTDRHGREVGTLVFTWEVDFVPMPDEQTGYGYETHAPGHVYGLSIHAARNALWWGGASRPTRYFRCPEERTKAIEKSLAAAQKRAVKHHNAA
jgi:hypothetical protein